MREDVSIRRYIVDLLGQTIADRRDDDSDPVDSTSEEPCLTRFERLRCDDLRYVFEYTKYLEYKCKKYTSCDELRDSSDDEHPTSRDIALDDPEWDIDSKCYQIGKSEEESYEDEIVEK
jgi:hypothetical protein